MKNTKMDTTMSLYTHVVLSDKAGALSSLPEFNIVTNFEQKTGKGDIMNDMISAKIPLKSEILGVSKVVKLAHKENW